MTNRTSAWLMAVGAVLTTGLHWGNYLAVYFAWSAAYFAWRLAIETEQKP